MGILLGLLTALTWGGADFLARFVTHRIGTLRTTLYMQLAGLLLLTILLPSLGGWGHLADGSGWRPWAWGIFAGTLNVSGTLALYRSFEIGKMAVVAPVSASYPALTLLLSWLTGEQLTRVRIAGIILTLVGVVVVAGGEKAPGPGDEAPARRNGIGIGWAITAALAFGFLFWLLGIRTVPRVGPVPAVWLIRLTSSVLATVVLFSAKQPMSLPRGNLHWMALGMGAMDTGAFVLSNRGMQMEQVAVISVLGSLYGAVTVCLAAIFLREHISRWQWFGIVTIFLGIFSISR
ncbi:MAG TPA: DMT family transporter [Candidatus Acidoferrum sp.]|nr:DMT family transporter [Candidatus Acidoferrum sp.]